MDFLGYVSTCGPGVHPVTTASIIKAESSFNPLTIRNNTLKRSYYPTDANQAIKLVESFTQRNHKLAIGLMQITNVWFKRFDIHPKELLDGCLNIRYGTKILALYYQDCQYLTVNKKAALECALSMYWSGRPTSGGAYVNNVYAGGGSHNRVNETPGVTDGVLYSTAGKYQAQPAKPASYTIYQKPSAQVALVSNPGGFTPPTGGFTPPTGGFNFPDRP